MSDVRSYPELVERLTALYNVRLDDSYRVSGPHGTEWHEVLNLGYDWSSYSGSIYDTVTERSLRAEFGEYLTGGDGDSLILDLCEEIPEDVLTSLVENLEWVAEVGYIDDCDLYHQVEEERISETWDGWLEFDLHFELTDLWEHDNPDDGTDEWMTKSAQFSDAAYAVTFEQFREVYETERGFSGWEHEYDCAVPISWEDTAVTIYNGLAHQFNRDTSRDPGPGQRSLF